MHCHSCGKVIEPDSRFCRYCGAAQVPEAETGTADPGPATSEAAGPSGTSDGSAWPLWLAAGGVVLLVIVLLALTRPSSAPSVGPASGNSQSPDYAAADAMMGNDVTAVDDNLAVLDSNVSETSATASGGWSYRTNEDKVRGGTSYFASTTSTNSIELDPPYEGGSTLEMTVRQSPAYGADILFILSSGQLLCHSYDGCYATVRFDDGPPERVELNEPSDNSSDTVFVASARPFIEKLKKAKRAIVELEIYQAGRPQFEFQVAGLKWAH